MCDFCKTKRNITELEDSAQMQFKYCPMCGDSLVEYNEYFISLNGGQDIFWIEDLDEVCDPETLSYIFEHTPPADMKDGIPVYRAHSVGIIQGYPEFEPF